MCTWSHAAAAAAAAAAFSIPCADGLIHINCSGLGTGRFIGRHGRVQTWAKKDNASNMTLTRTTKETSNLILGHHHDSAAPKTHNLNLSLFSPPQHLAPSIQRTTSQSTKALRQARPYATTQAP
ncbi:hypothetical protein IWZ03DRAFT_42062 [Phyllosticta citriasiana]|uniref:Secreted protein n=1 Tax=Phyllosticta citriasiana TaxID=595635 RepID=A0ABR1KDS1_9PEZI